MPKEIKSSSLLEGIDTESESESTYSPSEDEAIEMRSIILLLLCIPSVYLLKRTNRLHTCRGFHCRSNQHSRGLVCNGPFYSR